MFPAALTSRLSLLSSATLPFLAFGPLGLSVKGLVVSFASTLLSTSSAFRLPFMSERAFLEGARDSAAIGAEFCCRAAPCLVFSFGRSGDCVLGAAGNDVLDGCVAATDEFPGAGADADGASMRVNVKSSEESDAGGAEEFAELSWQNEQTSLVFGNSNMASCSLGHSASDPTCERTYVF